MLLSKCAGLLDSVAVSNSARRLIQATKSGGEGHGHALGRPAAVESALSYLIYLMLVRLYFFNLTYDLLDDAEMGEMVYK